jgi:hypothetical protein
MFTIPIEIVVLSLKTQTGSILFSEKLKKIWLLDKNRPPAAKNAVSLTIKF